MLKLMPNKKASISKAEPPMKHFSPVISIMSRFLLKNLLRLLSIPQNKQAPTISRLPAMFSVSVSFWNSPFVVTNTTPISNIAIPRYSLLAPRSFRNMNAIRAVNRDSALRSRDVLIAVV